MNSTKFHNKLKEIIKEKNIEWNKIYFMYMCNSVSENECTLIEKDGSIDITLFCPSKKTISFIAETPEKLFHKIEQYR